MDRAATTPAPIAAHALAETPAEPGLAAAALFDASPRGLRLADLKRLAQEGPAAVAQRQTLRRVFGDASGVAQMEETPEATIRRLLAKRRITISVEEAAKYAAALKGGELAPIAGHHRALRVDKNGMISTVGWRPPSDAARMRVSPVEGPMGPDQYSLITVGRRPLTGGVLTQEATIDAKTIGDVGPRASLAKEMEGSASAKSGTVNAEWLHLIAHSLGGPDEEKNLMAGPHHLNTAMIPLERTVRTAAQANKVVDYSVTFFFGELPRRDDPTKTLKFVHGVEISIDLADGRSQDFSMVSDPARMDEYISGHVLDDIEKVVGAFIEGN